MCCIHLESQDFTHSSFLHGMFPSLHSIDAIHYPRKKVKVKSLSHVWLFAILWTVAYWAPPSMGFSRQEYWSGFAISFSRGSSRPRDRTRVSHIGGRRFNLWATREAIHYPRPSQLFWLQCEATWPPTSAHFGCLCVSFLFASIMQSLLH